VRFSGDGDFRLAFRTCTRASKGAVCSPKPAPVKLPADDQFVLLVDEARDSNGFGRWNPLGLLAGFKMQAVENGTGSSGGGR